MIAINNLTFAYSGHPPIFQGYRLHVSRGEALSIIGPSGCGKTTLLYLLAGLRHPKSGTIIIDHKPISRPRPRSGLVLQDHGLLPWQTVRENARLGITIWGFRVKPINALTIGSKNWELRVFKINIRCICRADSANERPSRGRWQCNRIYC
jgi:ABC-type nitrate/sulfonate/bicarbonate transport system ATPase subunit